MVMALKKVPQTRLHWSKNNEVWRTPAIAKCMSRNRFESIAKCVHLVDNETIVQDKSDSAYSKISKTQSLVDDFNNLCSQM